MAETPDFEMRAGCLISLQTHAAPWLDQVAPGLSQLPPCRQMQQGQRLWLRLGGHEWWCWSEGPEAEPGPQMQAIAQAAGEHLHACVDISDGVQACRLAAPAEPLLSCGCDLDLAQLPPDYAGRTRLSSFTVTLAHAPGPGADRWLWVESSLAASLAQWLTVHAKLLRA